MNPVAPGPRILSRVTHNGDAVLIHTEVRIMSRRIQILAVALVAMFVAATAAAHNHGGGYGNDKDTKDIVDTAVAAGSFDTLVAAVEAAGLVETLKGDGPFTVFAPTDEAFAALPEGTVDALLEPENRDQLIAVLSYHVVAGKVSSEQVVDLSSAETLHGGSLSIENGYDGVRINGANIVQVDIETSNGVIHVIDQVLLP